MDPEEIRNAVFDLIDRETKHFSTAQYREVLDLVDDEIETRLYNLDSDRDGE